MLKNLYTYLFIDDLINQSAGTAYVVKTPPKVRLMRDLTWLMLCAYILFVFKPVMPVIADKVAHTFWEEYHLIVVHGVYGNAHVNIELDKTEKQSDKEKSSKSSSEEYVHLVSTTVYNFSFNYFVSQSYPAYKLHFPVSYQNILYQPPKA